MFSAFRFHNYTPELRDLVNAGFPIFTETWTTYVPEYKRILENKIVNNYLFNQICCEEPERFRHYLNTQLETIMPYYNQLYKSELIKFNPMLNYSISTEKRSVENLIKEANTANSSVGKQVRDFISSSENKGNSNGLTADIGERNKLGTQGTSYRKTGDEDNTLNINQTGTINEHQTETGTQNQDTTTSGTIKDNGTENVINGGKDIKTIDGTKSKTGTENKDETGTVTGEKEGKEDKTTNDTGTEQVVTSGEGKKDITQEEKTVNGEERKYSDTPQKALDSGSINTNYLTNYTDTDTNTTRNLTSAENNTYSETKDTTKQNDGTESSTSSGTDTQTFDKKYNTTYDLTDKDDSTETTEFGSTKNTTTDTTKTTNMNEDSTITKNLQTDKTTNRNLNEDQTVHKEWKENGSDDKTYNEKESFNNNGTLANNSENFESSQEVDNSTSSHAGSTSENTTQTTDTGDSTVSQGYTGISAAQLLMAFRETFINIDQMIIEELKENFMGVF